MYQGMLNIGIGMIAFEQHWLALFSFGSAAMRPGSSPCCLFFGSALNRISRFLDGKFFHVEQSMHVADGDTD